MTGTRTFAVKSTIATWPLSAGQHSKHAAEDYGATTPRSLVAPARPPFGPDAPARLDMMVLNSLSSLTLMTLPAAAYERFQRT